MGCSFFFKHKTAYEMRISDWSSDVCSSDLWPDAADFDARLCDWGITAAHQVVAYDDGDGAFAARLWFLLRALGHERAAVLDGGWKHWTDLGLPTQTGVREVTRVARTEHFDDERLLDAPQVQAHLARGGLLVDARSEEHPDELGRAHV